MKQFPIPADTRLKLTKATPRKETHGKELVQAISLRLEWWPTDNAAVNLLHEGLQDLLWWVPPEAAAQDDIDGVPAVKKHRRVPTLHMPLKVEAAFSGYTVTVQHGIDETTQLELYACALDKYEVDAKEGGSAVIRWSLATNKQVTPQLVGVLCGLEGTEIVATFEPPKPGTEATGAAIDGTVGHPGATGDGTLFDDDDADDAGSDSAGDGGGTFADDMAAGDSGAAEQAEIEAGMQASVSAAGLRPKRGARAH